MRWEAGYPLYVATLCFAFLLVFGEVIISLIERDVVKAGNLYGAAFDWSAIQTAFAFAAFAYLVGSSGDFLSHLRGTKAFRALMQYTVNVMASGFVLTISSIPMLIFEPSPSQVFSFSYVFFSLWCSLFLYCLSAFFRVGRVFWIIARVKDNDDMPG